MTKPRILSDLYRVSTRLRRKVSKILDPGWREKVVTCPVLVNSIPKSGTNLLKNIVLAIPGTQYAGDMSLAAERYVPEDCLTFVKERILDLRSGRIYTGHIPYSPEIAKWLRKQGIKQLFIYRDPRDVTVSLYHYIMTKSPRHAYYEMYAKLGSDSERLSATIHGIGEGRTKYRLSPRSVPNIRLVYEAYWGWVTEKNVFPIRYEDLVGETAQQSTNAASIVRRILQFLGVNHSSEKIDKILTQGMDPGKSHTFRRGRPAAWREEYTDQCVESFRAVTGDLLAKLGYTWE